ncbi:hypothetical protein QR680_012318 [Steinernema hermaphroditum]|uniref:Uncharacterized protein n=1 Tax=Steinernema hermaphroditum TaxID=289476 RepID=A0AA39I1M9_9BILA|nr:hypothetical protein QR680_012318 [Steinernema hermaphroditum]
MARLLVVLFVFALVFSIAAAYPGAYPYRASVYDYRVPYEYYNYMYPQPRGNYEIVIPDDDGKFISHSGSEVPHGKQRSPSSATHMRRFLLSSFLFLLVHASIDLFVPDGCWTDRWVLEDRTACKEKSFWLEWADRECGQSVYNYALNETCADGTYKRMDFVCCAPRNDSGLNVDSFKAHFKHHMLANFKHLYWNHKRLEEIKKNETIALGQLAGDLMQGYPSSLEAATRNQMSSQATMGLWANTFYKIYSEWAANRTSAQTVTLKENDEIVSKSEILKNYKAEVNQQVISFFFQSVILHVVEGISPAGNSNMTAYEEQFLPNLKKKLEVQFPDSERFPEVSDELEAYFYDELFDHLWGISKEKYKEITGKPQPLFELVSYYEKHVDEIFSEEDSAKENAAGSKIAQFLFVTIVVAMTFTAGLLVGQVLNNFYRNEKLFAFARFGQNGEPKDVVVFGKEEMERSPGADDFIPL